MKFLETLKGKTSTFGFNELNSPYGTENWTNRREMQQFSANIEKIFINLRHQFHCAPYHSNVLLARNFFYALDSSDRYCWFIKFQPSSYGGCEMAHKIRLNCQIERVWVWNCQITIDWNKWLSIVIFRVHDFQCNSHRNEHNETKLPTALRIKFKFVGMILMFDICVYI